MPGVGRVSPQRNSILLTFFPFYPLWFCKACLEGKACLSFCCLEGKVRKRRIPLSHSCRHEAEVKGQI